MQHTITKGWRLLLATSLLFGWAIAGIRPAFASGNTKARQLPPPAGNVLLIIDGAITRTNYGTEAHLDLDAIRSLPTYSLHTSTAVTDGVKHFEGVLMRDLLQRVGASGAMVEAGALNNYSVDIPIADFHDYDVVLATHMDGKQLLPSDKGPFWIVYPRDNWRQLQDIRYDYRWVWQLNRLTVK